MMILKKPTFILTILSLVLAIALAVPQLVFASTPGVGCPEGTVILGKYDWNGTIWLFDSWGGQGSDVINFNYPPTTMNIVSWYADPGIVVDFIVVTDGNYNGVPVYGTITIPDETNFPTYGYFTNAVMGTDPLRDISNILFCGSTTPVTLAAFTAQSNRGAVSIKWITATELNTAGFLVYRSTTSDGPEAKVTANLVAAQGNEISGASYGITDTPGYGTFYYWLEDVDFSGQSALHGPVAVKVLPAIIVPVYRPSLPGQ